VVKISEIARLRAFHQTIREGKLGREHAGIDLGILQGARIAEAIRNQGQDAEDRHEKNAEGNHHLDQGECVADGM
jgi:hypothetical protein